MRLIQGLDHIGIRVTDFDSAISFYGQFGFDLIREDMDERVVVMLHRSGVVINLLDSAVKLNKASNVLMDETVKYAGYTHAAFRVTDIAQAVRQLELLGIDITEGPVSFGDGKTSIFFRDQDRNVIEFTQPGLLNKPGPNCQGDAKQEMAE
jgi:lactoylglutathione lyase